MHVHAHVACACARACCASFSVSCDADASSFSESILRNSLTNVACRAVRNDQRSSLRFQWLILSS